MSKTRKQDLRPRRIVDRNTQSGGASEIYQIMTQPGSELGIDGEAVTWVLGFCPVRMIG